MEARVVHRGSGTISIGLTTSSPESRNLHVPGYEPGTIGLSSRIVRKAGESTDSCIFYGQSNPVEEGFKAISTNDILGCAVESIVENGNTYRRCSFTINGNLVGQSRHLEDHELFPTIMMNSPGAIIDTKFAHKQHIHDTKGNCQSKHFIELSLY